MQRSEIEREDEKLLGLESGIDALRVLHAANKQAGADECNKRQSYFQYDEKAAEGIARPANGSSASSDLQGLDQIGLGGLDRWGDANDHSGEQRHAHGE